MQTVTVCHSDRAYTQARQLLGRVHSQAVPLIDEAINLAQSDFPYAPIEAVVCLNRLSTLIGPTFRQFQWGEGAKVEVEADCDAPILLWIDAMPTEVNKRMVDLIRKGVDGTVVDVSLRPSEHRSILAGLMR